MPSGSVENERGVHASRQGYGESLKEQIHGRGGCLRQHEGEAIVSAGPDGGEDVGGQETLVAASWRTLAAAEPAMAVRPFWPSRASSSNQSCNVFPGWAATSASSSAASFFI